MAALRTRGNVLAQETRMRLRSFMPAAVLAALMLVGPTSAAVKKVAYPEVKVEVLPAFKADAAFEVMRKALSDAVAKKDPAALFALVGPTFVWTYQGGPTDQFDMGRDALHNFKVLFGFRPPGADADGMVENGPFWDALAGFVDDGTYYQATEFGNLVCGPIGANVVDDDVFDKAQKKIEPSDETADWYFTLAPTPVAKAPGDTGAPVAQVGTVALPALSTFPKVEEGQQAKAATHVEVLLPSGKSGWVPASAVRPLTSERLCFAKTAGGDWKIAAYDQTD
jgi:hypothetical protein